MDSANEGLPPLNDLRTILNLLGMEAGDLPGSDVRARTVAAHAALALLALRLCNHTIDVDRLTPTDRTLQHVNAAYSAVGPDGDAGIGLAAYLMAWVRDLTFAVVRANPAAARGTPLEVVRDLAAALDGALTAYRDGPASARSVAALDRAVSHARAALDQLELLTAPRDQL